MIEKMIVYFITDSSFGKHEILAEKALRGGVKAIQFREKRMSSREMYYVAKRLRAITRDYDALLFINDRVDIALAVDADGVHVGKEDLPAFAIKEFFNGYVGVTVRSVEEAKEVERFADYLGVGPVFATKVKRDLKPIGIEGLKRVVNAVNIPVIAIGGINAENAEEVFKTGVAGIAVISAIAAERDVENSARRLVETALELKRKYKRNRAENTCENHRSF